ncbi:MAG: hypothetical protein JNK05_05145 [Myxococcales bacterium]|nr:hypothetical protein [Myxococcales bacterium]
MNLVAACALATSVAAACAPSVGPPDAAPMESAATRALAPCRAIVASEADLATIASVTAHINRLPQPATVPCLMASLPRPFSVVATTSVSSAQPAFGTRSPRLFLFFRRVTLSVVAEGMGAPLVEFAEYSDAFGRHNSLKGEVELPSRGPLAADAAFARVRYGSGTSCGFCHRNERSTPEANSGFVSGALRPTIDSVVSMEYLRSLPSSACSSSEDASARCQFWHALFDYGDVTQGAFDPEIETLFR